MLTTHIEKKFYYKVFSENLMRTIVAVFMYSTTTKQEYEALNNNPEEFSDIAEYYATGDQSYYNLKVKAAVFVQVIAEKID